MAAADAPVPTHSVETLAFRSAKRARDLFVSEYGHVPAADTESREAKLASKIRAEYAAVQHVAAPARTTKKKEGAAAAPLAITAGPAAGTAAAASSAAKPDNSRALAKRSAPADFAGASDGEGMRNALALRAPTRPKPTWHPHWKLMRVISGHLGWVRSIAVDPSNSWFVTGSGDRTIKIWDLASGTLKLSLTGHISAIRGLAVSDRHPYLFSCGEDKQVKCWDLEQNKVIRHYHGHLSAVYSMALHPTLDVLMTGGRDSVVRVWDIRTKAQVHCLGGHTNTVASILTQGVDPQVISGSHDSTIRTWDLAAGKCLATLTNHKKSVRAIARHPRESTFASAAADNIKQWYLPSGKFIQNCSGHNAILNALDINTDDVMVAGADNGSLSFWDYRSGHKFQQLDTIAQPGSLESESGIYDLKFDRSFSRLITAEADKTIKIYKEDETSTPETHPLDWTEGDMVKKARF